MTCPFSGATSGSASACPFTGATRGNGTNGEDGGNEDAGAWGCTLSKEKGLDFQLQVPWDAKGIPVSNLPKYYQASDFIRLIKCLEDVPKEWKTKKYALATCDHVVPGSACLGSLSPEELDGLLLVDLTKFLKREQADRDRYTDNDEDEQLLLASKIAEPGEVSKTDTNMQNAAPIEADDDSKRKYSSSSTPGGKFSGIFVGKGPLVLLCVALCCFMLFLGLVIAAMHAVNSMHSGMLEELRNHERLLKEAQQRLGPYEVPELVHDET